MPTLVHLDGLSPFKLALQNGLLADNPGRSVRKVRVSGKSLRLPSAEQFADILRNVESSGAWCAYDAADLVRFLTYSGCRIHEAANMKRDDVDLEAGTIHISGDPVHGTKNSESRTIPINPAMHELCARLLEERREPRDPKRQGKGYMLKLTECRESVGSLRR
jgi:integrase